MFFKIGALKSLAKTPGLQFLFNKVAGVQDYKKDSSTGVFL